MASFCPSCGKPVPGEARFCPHCGAKTASAIANDDAGYVGLYETAADAKPDAPAKNPTSMTLSPVSADDPAPPVSRLDAVAASPSDTRRQPTWLWIAAGLAVLIGLAALMGFFRGDKTLSPLTDAELGSTETATGDKAFYAATLANVRAKPSTGSQLVDTLARGEEVRGTLVDGQGGPASWLKLDEDRYVSRANLLTAPPPVLASDEAMDMTIAARCSVVQYPSPGAPVATTLNAWTRVRVNGVTTNGYAELGLPKGGIGYADEGGRACFGSETPLASATQEDEAVAGSDAAPSAVPGPVAASGGCDFGAGIAPAFAAMATTAPGPGGLKFTGVGKTFHGITAVSAFATAQGQRGILFNAPLGSVRAAFERAGYEPPAGMELTVAHPNYRRFGQTMLTCRG